MQFSGVEVNFMNKLNQVFLLLAAPALAATLYASDAGVPIVTVGCVNRAAQNGSMSGTAAAPPATADTAGALANSSALTNSFMLNGATSPDASGEVRALAASDHPPTARQASYVLDGTRADIEPHMGHRVEVTGTLLTNNTGGPAAPAATKSTVQHIQVGSIRMIADSCMVLSPGK
jgi:hypothetical protein